MVDIAALKRANEKRWAGLRLTRNFSSIAQILIMAKPRYVAVSHMVEAATGNAIPWPVIAVIHMRESAQSWKASLAQGDPWDKVSVHVPKGRGPFNSWEDAAFDALVNCPPKLGLKRDWSLGATLTNLELYNGAGYVNQGLPSPYLWAGTNQYSKGKYVADGRFSADTVDVQPGCAGILKAMMALDPSITFEAPKTSTVKTSAGSVAAGGAAAGAAHQAGLSIGWIVAIALAVGVAAFITWKFKK
jgi:lysozyme family protein